MIKHSKEALAILFILLFASISYAQNKYHCGAKEITKEVKTFYDTSVKELEVRFNEKPCSVVFIDNSKLEFFPFIFNQKFGSCGQASSVGYIYTYEVNCLLNRNAKLKTSNRFSYMYTWNMVNNGTGAGSDAIDGWQIIKQNGAINLKDFNPNSYLKWPNGYDKYLRGVSYGIEDWYKIDATKDPDKAISEMKQYLLDHGNGSEYGGLIYFSANADPLNSEKYDRDSHTGYKDIITSFPTTGAHAMTIVGFDDSIWWDYNNNGEKENDEIGAFVCVNSWGPGWGRSQGRFYMPYKLVRIPKSMGGCDKYFFTVVPKIKKPSIVFKVLMEHSSRNDFEIVLGMAHDQNSTKPYRKKSIDIMEHQGGDHTLNGIEDLTNTELEFGLDGSFLEKYIEEDELPVFFLQIKDRLGYGKKGSGKIKSFSVMDYRYNDDNPRIYTCSKVNVNISDDYLIAKCSDGSIYEYKDGQNLSFHISEGVIFIKSLQERNVIIEVLDKENNVVKNIFNDDINIGLNKIEYTTEDLKAGQYIIRIKSYNQIFYKIITIK